MMLQALHMRHMDAGAARDHQLPRRRRSMASRGRAAVARAALFIGAVVPVTFMVIMPIESSALMLWGLLALCTPAYGQTIPEPRTLNINGRVFVLLGPIQRGVSGDRGRQPR
jgi:hypothetical protein